MKPKDLFEGEVETGVEYVPPKKVRSESAKDGESALLHGSGQTVKYQFLSASFPGRNLEAVIGEFPPDYTYPISSHEGEEFGYVLHGTLTVILRGESHVVGPGGSYQFKSTDPHGFKTEPNEGCTVLWIQTDRYTTPHENMASA